MNKNLFFGFGNAKLSTAIATFSLPAGHSCPFAKDCFSKADRNTGVLTDGKDMQFRCYAASQESVYRSVRDSRWRNFELLKKAESIEKMATLIQNSLPLGYGFVRTHISGDFFNEKYFLAWLNVALNNPTIVFYGYTKTLPFLIKYKKHIPDNFRFTASFGGTADNLISKYKLKYAKVVYSLKEAEQYKLEIDHDDNLAIKNKASFGLILHGYQPPNSAASIALKELKKQGLGIYNEETKKTHMEKSIKIYVNILSVKSKSKKKIYATR